MHFCYCAKYFWNIDSYICGRYTLDECADLTNNRYGTDELASCKTTDNFRDIRNEIAHYLRQKGVFQKSIFRPKSDFLVKIRYNNFLLDFLT